MYQNLKNVINQYIKTNGARSITGALLNGVLNDMVDALGAVGGYGGIITPTSAAPQNDGNVFFVSNTAGTYTNFSNIVVNENELAFIYRSGSGWAKDGIMLSAGGTEVEANPEDEPTMILNKIKIGETIYTAPQGPVGPPGADGQDGQDGLPGLPGVPGPANTLSIGTVTDGDQAAASITGNAPSQTLNLVLPKGEKGDPGTDGQDGQPGAPGQAAVNPFKGLFSDLQKLEEIEAMPGDFAYVLNGTPQSADIYIYDETAISTNYWADSLNDVDLSNIDYNGGITQAAKNLIISLFRKAVYDSDDADEDIDALEEEFEETRTLQSITAEFTQGGATIYDTDSLDVLKDYLVVTANYDNGTTEILNPSAYTLSGTLEAGQSTIYAVYNNVSDDFTVNVTHRPEVISFSASDLLNHYGLSNDYNQNNGLYIASNTKRCCYPYFDKLATGGKTYQVHVISNKQNTGVSLTFYAQSALDKVAQQESILAGNNDDKFDPGWVTLDSGGYGTIVIPAYVGSQDNVIRCVRYSIRVGDGTTDIPNDIVVTIELTEQVNI